MVTKSRKKSQKKFHCKSCLYTSSNKFDWVKHLDTTKHKMITNGNKKSQKVAKFDCICGKSYKFRSGLSRHKKNCPSENDNNVVKMVETVENGESSGVLQLCQTMRELVEDNRRKTELMEKILDQNATLIPCVGNNNNNKISINVFLNEHCKDAMNLEDFLANVKVSVEDLMYTKDNGYAKGIRNIFVKNLTDLEPTERPIHCSDKKRLQFYVKEQDKWGKDNENEKINKSIHNVSMKQIKHLKEWEQLHPNYLSDPVLTKEWHTMIQSMMGGANDAEQVKNAENIKRGISEMVDMKNAMG